MVIRVASGERLVVPVDSPQVVDVSGLRGITTVEIAEDGTVSVLDSECPGKHCVRAGKIREAGEIIVCAPNGVWVSIVGKDTAVDAVVF